MSKSIFLLMLFPFLSGCFRFGGPKLLWQAPVASETTPIVCNGTVYVQGFPAGHPEQSYRLFALEAATGKERWVSADSVRTVYGESGGSVFFQNMAGHLVQLDARTGEKMFESPDEKTSIQSWAIRGDTLFLVNGALEVVAVDNRQNKVLWRRQLPFRPGDDTELQLLGRQVIVSGNFRNQDDQFGMIWALDAITGAERWHFEVPPPHDYAPLKMLASGDYVLATNTAPTRLQTHVLEAATGREPYPPITAFDLYGCVGDTLYAPGGAFDLATGRRLGEVGKRVPASALDRGVAWHVSFRSVGVIKAFFLRDTYDGDYRGKRNWVNTPPNCSIEGVDMLSGKPVYHTKELPFTQFSAPVIADGTLYHTSIAVMKEGTSGVWAYRLPK